MGGLLTRLRGRLRWLRWRRDVQRLSPVSRAVVEQRLTYLSPSKLEELENVARAAADQAEGDFLEAGVALGGSGIVLAHLLPEGRTLHGYDVFGMIPPAGENDADDALSRYDEIAGGAAEGIGGDPYYGYMDDLQARVERSFAEHGVPVDGRRVALHAGLFEDTMTPEGPVALAHIDGDWYESVTTCLERVHPVLSAGGYVIVDDYHDYDGARRAVDDFLAGVDDLRVERDGESLVLQRVAPVAVEGAS